VKLYLSSDHLCNDPSRLSALRAKNYKVAVVQNALDASTDRERCKRGLESEFADLRDLGLSPDALDLRCFFGKADELEKRLSEFGYLWVTGGNTFVLRRAFAQSGLDAILQKKLPEEDFVYAGYSAGVCVLAPTLKGFHLEDDPEILPDDYSPEIIWTGLGFIPFSILPHYRSDQSGSEIIEKAVAYFIEHKMPFVVLRDGEALVLDSKSPKADPRRLPLPRR